MLAQEEAKKIKQDMGYFAQKMDENGRFSIFQVWSLKKKTELQQFFFQFLFVVAQCYIIWSNWVNLNGHIIAASLSVLLYTVNLSIVWRWTELVQVLVFWALLHIKITIPEMEVGTGSEKSSSETHFASRHGYLANGQFQTVFFFFML